MQSLYISAKYQAPAAHMNAFRFTFLGFQKAQFAIFFQISRMESRCLTSPVFNLAAQLRNGTNRSSIILTDAFVAAN